MTQRSKVPIECLLSLLVTLTFVPSISSGSGLIETIAGGGPNNLPVSQVAIGQPSGVAADLEGNRYFASVSLHKVFRVDAGGTITTVAGSGIRGFCGDDGPAIDACLDNPFGVTIDKQGNVFIADTSNSRIRKVDNRGIISTVSGNGESRFCGDDGPALSACLHNPIGVAVDGTGTLFIAGLSSHRIRKVDPDGSITTVVGNGGAGFCGDGGPAIDGCLRFPLGVAVNEAGEVFIADSNSNRIRKVNLSGIITTVAGSATSGFCGDGGTATTSCLANPSGVAVDGAGNLYIADQSNSRVRKVDGQGIISTIAGSTTSGFCGDDGPPTSACLANPFAVAVDQNGTILISDQSNSRIRVIEEGIITSLNGMGSLSFCGDTFPSTSACLALPTGIELDGSGNLFIADRMNLRIRKVDRDGFITTVAGNGLSGFCQDGDPATGACLANPFGIAVDGGGSLFIADEANHRIHKVDMNGLMTTVAGNGNAGFCGDNHSATLACLSLPTGVAVDGNGNIFIADRNNARIRKVDADGVIRTVAGNGNKTFCGDDGPATDACLNDPISVSVDSVGNLFIADQSNSRIRKVDLTGIMTTVAGSDTSGFCGDGGLATGACLFLPTDVAVDTEGNLFIADQSNAVIRKVNLSGTITTVAGNGLFGFSGDGGPAINASLANPFAIAVDQGGNLFIADQSNMRIRKVSVEDIVPPIVLPPSPITVEAIDALGAPLSHPAIQEFLTLAMANDEVDGTINPTHDAPQNFPLGVTTTVTFFATDNAGNIGSATSTVTVEDTIAPILSVPDNFSVEATGPSGAVVTYVVTAMDSVDASPTIICMPDSGTTLGIGTHDVSCTVEDSSGNVETASFQASVVDTTPPHLSVPAPESILLEATSSLGAVAQFTVTAEDSVDPAPGVTCTPLSGSTFALGTTLVDCSAVDAQGNVEQASFPVVVRDTTHPVLTVPADLMVEASNAAGAVVTFAAPMASDTVDPSPTVTCDALSGAIFPPGATTVACLATDASGNSVNGSFQIVVNDTIPPVLTVPENFSIEANGPSGAVVNYEVTATDGGGPAPTITCIPASGSIFALGNHTVLCAAEDQSGNVGNASFQISVVDTSPPLVTVPADLIQEATSTTGAVVTFAPVTATDTVDPSPTLSCTGPVGNVFPVGTTVVECTATDSSNNIGSASFQIVVQDTTPPILTIPAPESIRLEAASALGASAQFNVTAEDLVDPIPVITCTPPSGMTFGLGITPVACTATDASGNIGQASFEVVVQDTTPPVIHVPADFSVVADSFTGTAVTYSSSAVDSVDGILPTDCAPHSGNTFQLGPSQVTCTATDTHGNNTTATFHVQVTFPIDSDGDGITDSLDPDPTLASQNFTDAGLGGTTSGSISARGDQTLIIMDAPSPDGLYILADPTGGFGASTVRMDEPCVDPSGIITGITLGIFAGSESIITCSGFVLDVLRGPVEITFEINGDLIGASLDAGTGLRLDPASGAITVPQTGSPIVLRVNDSTQEIHLAPGRTIIPPVAVISQLSAISGTATAGLDKPVLQTVRLDGSESSDEDGAITDLMFKWTVDQEIVCEGMSTECMTIEIPLDIGNHVVTLRVTDISGLSDESSQAVTIDPTQLAVLDISNASVDFKHNPSYVKVRGSIDLPFGVDHRDLAAQVSVNLHVSGISLLNQMATLRAYRSHWKFRDKTSVPGLKRFDIDWKGARYRFKDYRFPVSLESKLITTTESILSIKIKDEDLAYSFTVDIDGQAQMAFDARGNITECTLGGNGCTTNDLEVEKPRKEFVLTLPFSLHENTVITFSGGLKRVIVVGDDLKPSIGRFQLFATFDRALFPEGVKKLPRELTLEVSVGSEGYTGAVSLDDTRLRVKRHSWKTGDERHHHHDRDRRKNHDGEHDDDDDRDHDDPDKGDNDDRDRDDD